MRKLIIHSRIISVDYVETDETVNYTSECSKLAEKECNNRYDEIGKIIY